VLVDQGRAERAGLDRPEHGHHLALRIGHGASLRQDRTRTPSPAAAGEGLGEGADAPV
jgi:hypothetical protein